MASFPYKKILVIGATSGIGEALAARFVKEGKKVVVVGRRQENLDSFVNKHGKDNASAIPFDISNFLAVPSFAQQVTTEHPDLDCVLLNSGIQRSHNFADPKSVNLDTINQEFSINYLAHVHLTTAFLPHLQKISKSQPASLLFTTSGLGLVPLIRCSNYSATKAAMHSLILCMREQLNDHEESNVKVIELLPPAVQTELHSTKHQPDMQNGEKMGMPLEAYIEATWAGLAEGKNEVSVGPLGDRAYGPDGFETKRQQAFMGLKKMADPNSEQNRQFYRS